MIPAQPAGGCSAGEFVSQFRVFQEPIDIDAGQRCKPNVAPFLRLSGIERMHLCYPCAAGRGGGEWSKNPPFGGYRNPRSPPIDGSVWVRRVLCCSTTPPRP